MWQLTWTLLSSKVLHQISFFTKASRAYISREILSRCTFGETIFLLISFFELILIWKWNSIIQIDPKEQENGIKIGIGRQLNSKNDINKKFVTPNVHRESISPEM